MDKLKNTAVTNFICFNFFFSCESKSELIVNNLLIQIENQKKLDSIDLNQLELAFNAFHYNIKNINRCVDSFSLELEAH